MTDGHHAAVLTFMYLLGFAVLGAAGFLCWRIYNNGYYSGFVEGEDHNAAMHEVSRRAQQEFLESADEMCVSTCTMEGFPSLNAFYAWNRSSCMCQDVGATDDIHGFFFLVDED